MMLHVYLSFERPRSCVKSLFPARLTPRDENAEEIRTVARLTPPNPPLQLRAFGATCRGGSRKYEALLGSRGEWGSRKKRGSFPPLHAALQSNAELERGLGGEARLACKSVVAYERRMDQLVTHPIFGYRLSYRRLLEVQARLLGRVLLGEIEAYPSFRTR